MQYKQGWALRRIETETCSSDNHFNCFENEVQTEKCVYPFCFYKPVCYSFLVSQCALLICLEKSSFGRHSKSYQCFSCSENCKKPVFPRNLSSGGKEGVRGRRRERVNLGKMVQGGAVSHQQVRGRECQQGPQGTDVTQWEGGGTRAGLNLEITSRC